MLKTVFDAFGLHEDTDTAVPFGSGLINHTWKVAANGDIFILQRLNHNVFKSPEAIAHNITVTGKYLKKHFPDYLFILPVKSLTGEDMVFEEDNGYFRLLPFVKNSHTVDVVEDPALAFEAAKEFGKFTRLLSGFDVNQLKVTLPDFHNLSLRYDQFQQSLVTGNKERIQESEQLIKSITDNKYIVDVFEEIKVNPQFKLRVTHHDTKISNVLFDENDKALCVIDLDTLMPGYFISDVGDMLRTYLCSVSEEEKDFSKIKIREDYFSAIVQGYLGELKDELSATEKEYFVFAGKFMIYMQAIRFLTDYINNDSYYGSKYEGHNLVRAGNQVNLLEKLIAKEKSLAQVVKSFLKS